MQDKVKDMQRNYDSMKQKLKSTQNSRNETNRSLEQSYDRIKKLRVKEQTIKHFGNISIGERKDVTKT